MYDNKVVRIPSCYRNSRQKRPVARYPMMPRANAGHAAHEPEGQVALYEPEAGPEGEPNFRIWRSGTAEPSTDNQRACRSQQS